MVYRSEIFNTCLTESALASAAPIAILCSALLAGCSGERAGGERALQAALPRDVVLLDSAATVGPRQLPIRITPPLKSEGEVSICLVLASGIRYDNRAKVDMKYAEMLQGARPTALLLGVKGNSYRFSKSQQGWTEYGRVTTGGELSNCLTSEAEPLPEGVEIDSIELTSDVPLKVLGIYWSSTHSL